MYSNDTIFTKIAEALLIDYTSVYYVNATTNEYHWFSINPEFHSLQLEPDGEDFFTVMAKESERVVYKDDQHIFKTDIQKDKLLKDMKDGAMKSIEYRLVIDGKPVWHRLRLIKAATGDNDYFVLGVLNVDEEVRRRNKAQILEHERDIYNQIASSLAEHYDTLYYINTETNHYIEFSSRDVYKNLNIPQEGKDFFKESAKNIPLAVHPEDSKRVVELHQKKVMLNNLKQNNSFTCTYRLIINGNTINCRNTQMWASDKKHIIVCIENINAEVIAEQVFMQSQKNSITYNAIAETLASHYDIIHYVDIEGESYSTFSTNKTFGNLEVRGEGEEFFKYVLIDAENNVFFEDKERVLTCLTKDYLISSLDNTKQFNMDYRLIKNENIQYTRLSVMFSSDHTHFIFGIENITEEINKEEEHIRALRTANEMARRDELTGAKNKNAYQELETNIQINIDRDKDCIEFAIVVCDLNNLKLINDTKGHKAGDEYIRTACQIIFDIFSHSPVFRIGGDEFAAVLTDRDYRDRDSLFENLREIVLENKKSDNKPVIATGLSVYDPENDTKVSDVFERADTMMYQNKKDLKST